jgi:hypothetical protein
MFPICTLIGTLLKRSTGAGVATCQIETSAAERWPEDIYFAE